MKGIATYFLLFFNLLVTAQDQTVGVFINDKRALNGYTLFGNNETSYLIDNCGFVVNQWQSAYKPGNGMYLLPNGDLLRCGRLDGNYNAGGIGGRYELFNWEGDLIWSYNIANAAQHGHHDIAPLPNGNFLAIIWELKSESDAKAKGRAHDGDVWSERIIEIEMIGSDQANVVWEWSVWDHLIQDFDPSKPNFGIIADHPNRLDINYIGKNRQSFGNWLHLNSIDYNVDLNQIVISSSYLSEAYIIDHSTSTNEAASTLGGKSGHGGDFLYRYGNPQVYDRGNENDRQLQNQHDVRWIKAEGNFQGHLIAFNNEFVLNESSSVQIWTTPINGEGLYDLEEGQPYGPSELDWSFSADKFHSAILSGADVMPNGNVFICEGFEGHFIEVTQGGEVVWEYINPVNRNGFAVRQGGSVQFNQTFRANKYANDFPGFAGKDLTPGVPVEIIPWDLGCTIYNQTTPIAQAMVNNALDVEVTNPITDILAIRNNGQSELEVNVINVQGQVIAAFKIEKGDTNKEISLWPAGIYFIRFLEKTTHTIDVIKVLKD